MMHIFSNIQTMLAFTIGFLDIGWIDALDMFLVGILLYQIYLLVRGSLASRVFLGYLLIYISYLIVKALGLQLLTTILEYFMGVGAIALIVIFQQEIRRFLLIIGKSTIFANNHFFRKLFHLTDTRETTNFITPIVEAVKTLSAEFTGALVVIKKNDELDKYIESGEMVDALLSKRLLVSIFNEYGPLHEGGVVIDGDRIKAARCILPVSDSYGFGNVGFRHRAAIGMSEATDAFNIIVSEESGKISAAIEGNFISNINIQDLESRLRKYLLDG